MTKVCTVLLLVLQLSVFAQKADSLARNDVSMEIFLDELEITDQSLTQNPSNQNTDVFLHQLNGVNMMRRGNFANEPILRGLNTDRVIVAIDGMRIFGGCTDKMDPVSAYVEPVNLRTLDVNFGSAPGMMGNSTGGAINFQLKKPVYSTEKKVQGSAGVNYGSVAGSFDQLADLNWSGEHWAARFSGVHRKAHNYTDGNGDEVAYSQYEKYNYSGSLSYRFRDHLINLDFLGDDGYNIGYPALTMDVSSAKAKMFSLTYLGKRLGFLTQPEFKVYHNFVHHIMDDSKREEVAMHMDMPGKTHTTGMYLKGQTGENLQMKLEVFHTYAHADMVMYANESDKEGMYMETWPDVYRNQLGYEVAYNHRYAHVAVHAGGRLEFSKSGLLSTFGKQEFSIFGKSDDNSLKMTYGFSAGLDRIWSERQSTGVQLSTSSRLPTITEQFGYYLYNRLDGFDYIGDPGIKTEKSVQLDVRHQVKAGVMNWSVAGFGYLFKDYIMGIYDSSLSAMTSGARGVKRYTNAGRAWMWGGEAAAEARLSASTQMNVKASYVFGADFEEAPLPQMPPLKILFGVSQEIKGFQVTPQLEWSARQDRISKKFYESKTASYYLINLNISRTVSLKSLDLSINTGVQNLLNEAYREHFDMGGILRPGRQFYLNLKVKW